MRFKFKIKQKIQIFIISATLIIYVIAVGYISLKARENAYEDATNASNSYVKNVAINVQDKLNANMAIITTMTSEFRIYDEFGKDYWQILINKMYKGVFADNYQVYGLWDSWELSAIDSTYTKDYGRITNTYWRSSGTVKNQTEYRSMDGNSPIYEETKLIFHSRISEPYFDIVTSLKQESLLMVSLTSPVIKDNEFKAVIAVDITLESIQKIVNEIHPYEGSYAFMISNKGIITGHPNSDYLNVPLGEVFLNLNNS